MSVIYSSSNNIKNKNEKTREFAGARAEDGGDRYASSTGDRIFINVGKMDGLEKGNLLELICDFGEVKGTAIGKIDLKGAYSFFEIEKEFTDQVMKGFEGVELRGRKVRLEMTEANKEKYSDKKKERFYGSKSKSSAGGSSSRGARTDSRGGDRGRSKRY